MDGSETNLAHWRRAVLFALGELTGLQAGNSSLDWRLALWTGADLVGK
jgi:hypothetical protein